MYYNTVILLGTVGKVPQYIGQNNTSAIFPLEQKKAWVHKRSRKRYEEVQYHRIEVSGSMLKSALPILLENTIVLVEGELISKTINPNDGNDGMKSYMIISEVVARRIKKIGQLP